MPIAAQEKIDPSRFGFGSDRLVGGDHDYWDRRAPFAYRRNEFDAVNWMHTVVCDHNIHRVALEKIQCLLAGMAFIYAGIRELGMNGIHHEFPLKCIVIHHQKMKWPLHDMPLDNSWLVCSSLF